jgi:hypothetical protein
MSKWPMRGHFQYLRFKKFLMTPKTLQCEVFWALLLRSEHSGVLEDSKSPTLQVLGFTPTLCQSGVATKVYYKGEGGGPWWVVCPCCPWLVLTPKMLQLCTNHFVFVLCKPMWVSEACHFFLVPFRSSSTPLYPSKVLRARERAPTPCSSVVFI